MIYAVVRLGIRAALCAAFFVVISSLSHLCPQAWGQSQTQQYVYGSVPGTPPTTSTIPAFAKNGQTGALASVPGAPFPDRLEGGFIAVDALGRFLFVLNFNTSGISMYQINSSTGALAEVPNSPFSSGKTINLNQAPANPVSLATEKSGKYLYVGYTTGNFSNTSAITPFNIDATNLVLTLTGQLSFDVAYNPLQMFSDPRGLFLYTADGVNPFNGTLSGGASVYSITPTDGSLALINGQVGGGTASHVMAIDPQGRFFFNGTGQFAGSIFWGVISPLDGTSIPSSQPLDLGENNLPRVMVVDSSGKFLYVQQDAGLVIYSIDQTTGQPTPLNAPQASPTFRFGNVVADPAGPFLYSGNSNGNGVSVFQINPQDGSLAEITNPSSGAGAIASITISGTSSQPISGPNAAFDQTSLNFGSVTESQPITRVVHLVNNGDQTLTINTGATTITGANSSDFSQTTTCQPTLAANANCSFSVTFTPSVVGTESASLQITDNAPGSPQTIPLSGTGMAPSPSISFIPGSIVFNTISQGATDGPRPFQVTNIGSAPLHISAVALGGGNVADFSQTNNCTSAPLALEASCTINVTFTPQATGERGATISVTDDAPNSPQLLFVTGTGATAFVLSPAPQSTTTASVTAGQTANYGLQLNPGTGFLGTISLSCTGAPVGAKCNLSSNSLAVTSSNPVTFSAAISTTGSSSAIAPVFWLSRLEWRYFNLLMGTVLFLLVVWTTTKRSESPSRRVHVLATIVLALAIAGPSGCGGGSMATTPPNPAVTPKGSYLVTVTATAGNLTPQTITLTLNVN